MIWGEVLVDGILGQLEVFKGAATVCLIIMVQLYGHLIIIMVFNCKFINTGCGKYN